MGIIKEYLKGFFIVFRCLIPLKKKIHKINKKWNNFYRYTLIRDGYIDTMKEISHFVGVASFVLFMMFIIKYM